MSKEVNVNAGALGSPAFLVFLIFMTLKLLGKITWSWFWVTAPLWGSFAFVGAILTIYIVILIVAKLFE